LKLPPGWAYMGKLKKKREKKKSCSRVERIGGCSRVKRAQEGATKGF